MGKKTEETEQENKAPAAEEPEVVSDTEGPSADEQLQTDLDKARQEAKAHQEQYLRTLADMENLRKRTQREKEELAKFANENILREILPVVDNLERALEHADQKENDGSLLEGVQMTLTQFGQVLNRFGVEPIEALGKPFDPAVHQAMGQMESAEQAPNTVVQQMQKGYQLNERLLRPAFVMVAKAPVAPQDDNDNKTESATDEQLNDSE